MRKVFAVIAGLLALVASHGGGIAQDATPEPTVSGIPPVVWQLAYHVDVQGAVTPISGPYTIQFLADGSLALKADCNVGFGSYVLAGSELTISDIGTTLMLCPPGSLGDQYLQQLGLTASYVIDQDGLNDQLVLALQGDAGFLSFSPSLTGVIWEWNDFQGSDGTVITPSEPANYWIEFNPDGTMTAQVDCNRGFGSYSTDGSTIAMLVATTRIGCSAESQGGEFGQLLAAATTFIIRDGQLALTLPGDGGVATFNPVVPSGEETPES